MAFDFPNAPTEGQTFTPPGGPTYRFVTPKWTVLGSSASVEISDTAPSNPSPGNLWWEADTGKLFVWYSDGTSSQWVEAAGGGRGPAAAGWRNLIINGDFVIDQRNNGALASCPTAASTYTLDRWLGSSGQAPGSLYMQRISGSSITISEYTMVVTPQVIDATIAAGDHYRVSHNIEGNFCRGLNWGSVAAKPVTLSFIADAINGPFTLSIAIRNSAGDRAWLGSFTTKAARQSITIPGDTGGTWLYDNGVGIRIEIGLAIGTTYHGVPGWNTTALLGLPGMSNFMSATANQLYLRDFQLEVGTQATEFERVPYDQQLARCQRYYEASGGGVGSGMSGNVATGLQYNAWGSFLVTKRTVPTMVFTNINNSGFAATPGTAAPALNSFLEGRVSNATANGSFFHSNWTATAEL